MTFGWPQIILVVWLSISICANIALHGQPNDRDGFVTFLRAALLLAVLYWGGFFGSPS
jgi:hypothetical protein